MTEPVIIGKTRQPHLKHYCREWDLDLIGPSDPEIECCICFKNMEIIGNAILYLGDSSEIIYLLPDSDVLITDPPYGVEIGSGDKRGGPHGLSLDNYQSYDDTYENFVNKIVPTLTAAIKKTQRSAIFIGPHIHEMPKFDALGGVYCSAATGRHKWGYKNFLPVLLYGAYPDLNNGARFPTVIASNETAEKNGHPVPKPLGWMKWLVNLTSRHGETILDPYMGSGTTGVACMQMGRQFIGIEKEPRYFDIACRRIEQAQRQPDMFIEPKPPAIAEQLSMAEAFE